MHKWQILTSIFVLFFVAIAGIVSNFDAQSSTESTESSSETFSDTTFTELPGRRHFLTLLEMSNFSEHGNPYLAIYLHRFLICHVWEVPNSPHQL